MGCEGNTYCTCKESLDALAIEQERLRVFVMESIARHSNAVGPHQGEVCSDSQWCPPVPAQTADTKDGGAQVGQGGRTACFRFKRFPFRWGPRSLKVTLPRRK